MEPICSMKVSYHFSVSRLVLLVSFSSSLSFSLVFIIQDSNSSKFVTFLVCLYNRQSGSARISNCNTKQITLLHKGLILVSLKVLFNNLNFFFHCTLKASSEKPIVLLNTSFNRYSSKFQYWNI